jgi:hypothetical protein
MKKLIGFLFLLILMANPVSAQVFPTAVATDADLFIATNKATTALTADITSDATTIAVTSTAAFGTTGIITIDIERIKYTGKTSTTFTGCTRAYDGSSPASHRRNVAVNGNIVAAHHNVLKEEIKAVEGALSYHGSLIPYFLGSRYAAGAYNNFGTTYGFSGYGLRDYEGRMQYKNSSGSWLNIGTGEAGSGVWGSITGTLASQDDLVTALGLKEPTISAGTTSQYWRGDKSWQTLDKSAVGLGSVENSALSTWTGSSNLTTVGTLSSGTIPWSLVGTRATTLSGYGITDAVPSSRTVNGHELSSNVSVSKDDVGLGSVENTALSTWSGTSNIVNIGTLPSLSLSAASGPTATFLDTDGTLISGGKWRFKVDDDLFKLQLNTAAGGDFSTNKPMLQFNQYGALFSTQLDIGAGTPPSVTAPWVYQNYNTTTTSGSSSVTAVYASSYARPGSEPIVGVYGRATAQPVTDGVGEYTNSITGVYGTATSYGSGGEYLGPASILSLEGVKANVSVYPNSGYPLTVTSAIGMSTRLGFYRSESTVTNAYHFKTFDATNSLTNPTIGSEYGFYFTNPSDANRNITNLYGLYIEAPTRATNNYGIYNGGTLNQVGNATFGGTITLEGGTYDTTVSAGTPTAARSLTHPDVSGCLLSDASTTLTEVAGTTDSVVITADNCKRNFYLVPTADSPADGFTLTMTGCVFNGSVNLLIKNNSAVQNITYGAGLTVMGTLGAGSLSQGNNDYTKIHITCVGSSGIDGLVDGLSRLTEPE